jgi:dTDP-4-dehydrorhamnose reductase
MKPKIIGLGLNGLVGTRVAELLSNKYEFISLSRSTGVDITNKSTLGIIGDLKEADFVLHFAAKADVEGCEKDKELGENGEAWRINVSGTENVVDYCRDFGKKMIYISTDFVFDGDKPKGEFYTEEDSPNPINWYAKTKYEGEKIIEKSGSDYVILRIAYPYRANFEVKKDFMRAIKDRLENGEQVKAVTDHYFCPTFIDDIAHAIDKLVEDDAMGIYHAVGSEVLSPYDAAMKISDAFSLDRSLISKTTRDEFFANRAPRPFNLALRNDKIQKLGVKMKGFEEGLLAIGSQLK